MKIEDAVRDFAAAMRAAGATKAKWIDHAFALELELGASPSSGDPMPKKGAFADDGAGLCACGHHPVVEHTEAGCLMGCAVSLCASKPGEPEP